jgi:hypothetical protein
MPPAKVQRGRYQEDLRNILIMADNVHRQFATLGKRISHLILPEYRRLCRQAGCQAFAWSEPIQS